MPLRGHPSESCWLRRATHLDHRAGAGGQARSVQPALLWGITSARCCQTSAVPTGSGGALSARPCLPGEPRSPEPEYLYPGSTGAGRFPRRLRSGGCGEEVFVDADLELNQVEASIQLLSVRVDALLVPAQQVQPLSLVAIACPDQFGVTANVRQWHAGAPEDGAQREPVDVVFGVQAPTAGRSAHRLGQNPLPLVEAERVHAKAGARRNLPDAQLFRLVSHAAILST